MPPDLLLVVEDDESIGAALSKALTSQGHDVTWVRTGEEALARALERRPSLVLLDLGLPDLDGVEVCRQLRAQDSSVAILMLTARHAEVDVVLGLDAGANDYVTKPFRLAELLARVRAHLRQSGEAQPTERVAVGDVDVDLDARRAWVGSRELELRAKEFDLLAYLISNAGSAVTREQIMSSVWDEHWFGSTKTLDMHISALRRKLAAGRADVSYITTLRGVGYRFEHP
jgi:DNA-binding response OmpR family regulator